MDFIPFHTHLVLKAYTQKAITDCRKLEEWMTELVALVGMHVMIPAKAVTIDDKNNEGPTCLIALKESHASCHLWAETNPQLIQFDLYSCREFDKKVVINHLHKFMPLSKVEWFHLDRNHFPFQSEQGVYLFNDELYDMIVDQG